MFRESRLANDHPEKEERSSGGLGRLLGGSVEQPKREQFFSAEKKKKKAKHQTFTRPLRRNPIPSRMS